MILLADAREILPSLSAMSVTFSVPEVSFILLSLILLFRFTLPFISTVPMLESDILSTFFESVPPVSIIIPSFLTVDDSEVAILFASVLIVPA